jgi:hypothetical protein
LRQQEKEKYKNRPPPPRYIRDYQVLPVKHPAVQKPYDDSSRNCLRTDIASEQDMHIAQDRQERARGKLRTNLKDCRRRRGRIRGGRGRKEEALYRYPITI